MKSTFFGVCGLLIFVTSIFAQISPTPVINNEMRDGGSIRRRSMEFERLKREVDKPASQEPTKEQALKFAEIKEDFENIQKHENEIIQTYNSGSQINYKKISDLALEISKKAVRLEVNLFIPSSEKNVKNNNGNGNESRSIRDLIIELDRTIGSFVSSPIFSDKKLIDSKVWEKAGTDLDNIIRTSERLTQEAKKNI